MTGCPDAFSLNPVPEIHFGPGHARLLADDVRALSGGTPARVLLVADIDRFAAAVMALARTRLKFRSARISRISPYPSCVYFLPPQQLPAAGICRGSTLPQATPPPALPILGAK